MCVAGGVAPGLWVSHASGGSEIEIILQNRQSTVLHFVMLKSSRPSQMVFRYIYQKILSMDGNFRIQNTDNSKCDDPLGPGWCVFVHPLEYTSWLAGKVSETNGSI
jgi:hypothetical protein